MIPAWTASFPSALAIAAGIDFLIGDPWNWWHPVQGMGWAIAQFTDRAWRWCKSPRSLRLAGIGLGLGLILGCGLLGWTIVALAYRLHFLAGLAVESGLLASCFAGRSLRDAAEAVLRSLATGDLVQTRAQLSLYVGRDTENLTEAEILRAVLETVTENATDGVLAPLFYAIVGAAIPGVGAVPLALAYKAASTLDSTVGYRRSPYTDIGWFSAKLEDGLTWLPCRLVVLSVALLSGRPGRVLQWCWRDAPQDASPNSGWSECAYAAALEVQMGGSSSYKGITKLKPLLGENLRPIDPSVIRQALGLTRTCFLVWLGVAIVALSSR
jgi:adenosylcobinamide-phosphate synthase